MNSFAEASARSRTTARAQLGGVRGLGAVAQPVDHARPGRRPVGANTARSPERSSPSIGAPALPRSSDCAASRQTLRVPLDQGDGGALAGRGLDVELVDEPPRPGSPRPRPRPWCSRRSAPARDRRCPGPGRARRPSRRGGRGVAHELEEHLAALGVGRDVAGDLGDRGGQQRLVGARHSSPIASARARWRAVTTSASDSMAIRSAASGATEPRL